jgi:hypothetical protein
MFTRTLVLAGTILVGLCLATIAQPPQSPEAMRTHADELARQAAELRAKGDHERAKTLAREAEELLKAAAAVERDEDQPLPDQHRLAMEAELAKLRADRARLAEQGLKNAIEPIDVRIADLERALGHTPSTEPKPRVKPSEPKPVRPFKPQPRVATPQEIEGLERRIHHLRLAADNLHAAGLHERAKELEVQALDLERELDLLTQPEPIQGNERIRILEELVDDLRNEVNGLREEIRVLREQVASLAANR